MKDIFYKLMLVTHRENRPLDEYLLFIEECLGFGVSSVQLREKNGSPSFILDYATQLKSLLDRYKIPLLVNDNIELALQINAHGVHLGQTDGCPLLARQRLGAEKWIGVSIETEAELEKANHYPIDYVAASAVFPTNHKANIRQFWGLDGVSNLAKHSLHPLVAIGGINDQNITDVLSAGAQGIAVIGAIHDAKEPAAMTLKLRQLIDKPFQAKRNDNNDFTERN